MIILLSDVVKPPLDEPDSDWLNNTADEKEKDWTEFRHRCIDCFIETRAVLTPEQCVELEMRYIVAHDNNK